MNGKPEGQPLSGAMDQQTVVYWLFDGNVYRKSTGRLTTTR
jgi:hypothetical protein